MEANLLPPYKNGIAPFPVQRLGGGRVHAPLERLWRAGKAYAQAMGIPYTYSGAQGIAPF